jgi:hypothetical protein
MLKFPAKVISERTSSSLAVTFSGMLGTELSLACLVSIRTVPVTDSGKRTQFSCTNLYDTLIEISVKRRSKIRAEKVFYG